MKGGINYYINKDPDYDELIEAQKKWLDNLPEKINLPTKLDTLNYNNNSSFSNTKGMLDKDRFNEENTDKNNSNEIYNDKYNFNEKYYNNMSNFNKIGDNNNNKYPNDSYNFNKYNKYKIS